MAKKDKNKPQPKPTKTASGLVPVRLLGKHEVSIGDEKFSKGIVEVNEKTAASLVKKGIGEYVTDEQPVNKKKDEQPE